MSALGWVGVGAGTVWLIGLIVACIVERENAEMMLGFILAVLVGPVLALAELLRRLGLFGAVPLDPRALEQFARMKHRGGGRALALHYSPRLGVIFVRGMRENEAVPPIRVRSFAERETERNDGGAA